MDMRFLLPLAFCPIALLSSAQAQPLPDGPGKDAVASVCTQCHGLDRITPLKRSAAAWKETVSAMRAKGADGTDQEFDAIVNYLAKNVGAPEGAVRLAGDVAATPPMPDGPGKQFILMQCTA